jgi:hypothetical protein
MPDPATSLLRTAEDELQRLRALIAAVAGIIHSSIYDYDTRCALAKALGLPEPTHPNTTPETP